MDLTSLCVYRAPFKVRILVGLVKPKHVRAFI